MAYGVDPAAGYGAPAPARRRPRWGRRLLIALLVLVVLLVVADRVGDYAAERIAAERLQSSQGLTSRPDVDINGFPFLTQAASGHYHQVVVDADDVRIGSGTPSLTLDSLRVTLDDLTVSQNFSRVHADEGHAVGTLGFDRLSAALGVDVTYAGEGRVKASKQITLLGQTVTPTVTAAPELVDGALGFGKGRVNGLADLGSSVEQVVSLVFGVKVPLDGVPFDVRVQKLSVTAQGLRVDLAGADLTYTR